MSLVYRDKILDKKKYMHPSYVLDTEGPCYKMLRYSGFTKEGKKVSVFEWTEEQALAMYEWYVQGYAECKIVTEFGDGLPKYEWQDIISKSHYESSMGEISEMTITDAWRAEQDRIELELQEDREAKDIPDPPSDEDIE